MAEAQDYDSAIVVIGGGNGASVLLRGLADADVTPNITAVLTVFDDGGSTGILRREDPTLLAPGDVRRGLSALATDREAAADFERRLDDGHVVGNVAIANLTKELGSFEQALEVIAKRLGVTGRVLPVSRNASTLVLDHLGERVVGEHNIGNYQIRDPWARVSLEPPVSIHPEVAKAIRTARPTDVVAIGAGSLYTSLGAALAPQGMRDALKATEAKLVVVANLHPEENQTPEGWHVADHVLALEALMGRRCDYVLYHDGPLPDGTLPLDTSPAGFDAITAQTIGVPMATVREKDGRIVHDGRAAAAQIAKLLITQPEYARV